MQIGNGAAAAPQPYLHDPHGNMLRMPHLGGGAEGTNMHWDYRDQLHQADLGGGGAAFYVYDASGQRVRKVVEKAPGLIEERLYLGGFEIFRRHNGPIGANTATLERETLHVMDDQQRIALLETRTLDTVGNDQAPRQLIRYQVGNHLGSASLELDEQAQIISYEEYSPYGSTSYQAVRSQMETAKRYRFTGMERDEESGLAYHGARYYAVWIASWISCDPSGLRDALSLYVYVAANPIRHFDPTGGDLWDVVVNSADLFIENRVAPAAEAAWNQFADRGEELFEAWKHQNNQVVEQLTDALGASRSLILLDGDELQSRVEALYQRQSTMIEETAVGAVAGVPQLLQRIGESAADVMYYHPELFGPHVWLMLPSHADEQDADTKTAAAAVNLFLDVPQLVLMLEPLRSSWGSKGVKPPSGAANAGSGVSPHGSSPAASGPRFVSEVITFEKRDIIVVETADGKRQAFYKSSGKNSGPENKGRWFPFDGISPVDNNHFFKDSYTVGPGRHKGAHLHRYGTSEYLDISNQLNTMNIPEGTPVTRQQANEFIRRNGGKAPSF